MNNYQYDALGNLIGDKREEIGNMEWTVAGKVKHITRMAGSTKPELWFTYGADGQRTSKTVGDPSNGGYKEYYLRDAQGNIMAMYRYTNAAGEGPSLKVTERPVYGSARIGSYTRQLELYHEPAVHAWPYVQPMQAPLKHYELTDHLGNVAAVVTGRLLPGNNAGSPYQPELVSAQGYEAFGSLLPGRNYSADAYRFGFNGKENDDEVFGAVGTFQDYGMRAYDTRVGRFFSVDPLAMKYPMLTPYQIASNTPIWGIDLDGEELRVYTESGNFIRGNVGHTFISIGSGEDLTVYTYGRYDDVEKNKGSMNSTNLSGEGVLIRLTGESATSFIGDHVNKFNGRVFELTDVNKTGEARVKFFFETKMESSTELPDREGGKYFNDSRARVIDTYSLLGNNCTTISCAGSKEGGTRAFSDVEYVTPLKPDWAKPIKLSVEKSFLAPFGLEQYLENKSKAPDAPVKDITDDIKVGG